MITYDKGVIEAVSTGSHYDPHAFLGAHPDPDNDARAIVRVRRPLAESVSLLLTNGETIDMEHIADGMWIAGVPAPVGKYRIRTTYPDGPDWLAGDPYRHTPTIGELDLHLIAEGRHERLWEVLGAHPQTHEGEPGTAFAVWAPNARAVRVVGDHNDWSGEGHAMRSMGASGLWEIFIPDTGVGTRYKYEILTPDNEWVLRADPLAQHTEAPPATASIVTRSEYRWNDGAWMTRRAATHAVAQPLSIYELHLGSWRRGLDYRQAATELIAHIKETGFTHVEFLPLAEHPFGGSWGYQVTGYYAPTARYGSPDDLRFLIDQLHQAGIGVILDWVPAHFPRDAFALAQFDGRPLYEHPDPRRGEHRDWGTLIFDYGRPEVRNFLVANALYWLREFHIDGLRVDAVASMLYLDYSRDDGDWEPNIHGGRENLEAIRFLQELNATAYRKHPGIMMIAEESTSFPGVTSPTNHAGLGFGFKWNMGWMNDSLQYIRRDPLHRAHHHGEITFSFVYAFGENYILPISHDEVVHGKGSLLAKMPGSHEQKLATVRAYLAYMWAHPGKKLLFMGQEFGQLSEWAESNELEWWLLEQPLHQQLIHLVSELNRLYKVTAPLWVRDNDATSFSRLGAPGWDPNIVAFARRDGHGGQVVSITNFAGVALHGVELDLPRAGTWQEILNTDALEFGGHGEGNLGAVYAHDNTPKKALLDDASRTSPRATLMIPALTTLWLRYQPGTALR
ncbi:1,4-alpha-glucan branching protein GlgB [Microbacterium sp. YY-01]|uniref:1,4-alpha-glucan branching protein GlgB n=1 Tax=Microbacterium sp. YY-01 TaxID=3421634 RepID=UPI003D17624C